MTIENEQEFKVKIDEFGEKQNAIESLKNELSDLKTALESYANKHNLKKCDGEKYRLMMVKGDKALRRQRDIKESDVIARLKKTEVGKSFITTGYDNKAIKATYGKDEEMLASFGLCLTEPNYHAKVVSRKESKSKS